MCFGGVRCSIGTRRTKRIGVEAWRRLTVACRSDSTGTPLDILKAAEGNVAVVIFSFSRAGGRDAQNWAQHLTKDQQQLPLYTAIFLESVPRFFRSAAVSGIRSGMSPAKQDRTLLLYQQQSLWEHRLHVTDESDAYLLVLDRDGHIRWMLLGPFADALYLRLKQELQR
jgi:hypothetical protein